MLGGKKKDTMIEMKSSKSKALVEYREEKKCKNEQYKTYYSKESGKQSQHQARSFTVLNSTVTIGNADGSYISSSRTRMTGSEGVTFEKSKEAETAIRQKRISSETATRLGQLKTSDTATTGGKAKLKSSDTATGQAKLKSSDTAGQAKLKSSDTATKQAKPKSSNTATKQVKPKISGDFIITGHCNLSEGEDNERMTRMIYMNMTMIITREVDQRRQLLK